MFEKEVNTVHINLYFTIVVGCQSAIKVKIRVVIELNQLNLTKAYFIPPIHQMNSVGIQVLSHTSTTSSDQNTMTKVDRRNIIKKKKHTCFEWTELIATICIPLIIAVYTIIENHNSELIAAADRHKDIEIDNNSRTSAFEIAQADRLNEIAIAEQSRQKDRDLAVDQQRENILVEYRNFLAKLMLDNGLALNMSRAAKTVAKFMTLTTLNQLNTGRKSILVRSLYEAKLITLKMTSTPWDTSVLELGHIDLSDLTLGSLRDSPDERPKYRYIDWYYLYLPYATLTNASFRHTLLDCATLSSGSMDSIDLSFATEANSKCFGIARAGQTDFSRTSLVNASLYKPHFSFTDFSFANLTFANIRHFYCLECSFFSATLYQADLSFSKIINSFLVSQERLIFNDTNLKQAVIQEAHFRSMSFSKSDWSNVQASQIILWNCTFTNAIMKNCSLMKSAIDRSEFQNASLFGVDLSDAVLNNVSFVNSVMRNANMSFMKCNYCDFTNVTLEGAVLKNASLRHSIFFNCRVNASQLEEVIDLSGSTLPNGTVVETKD
jgi:uncharacterized protein YjbI with pentapeptide repeats